MNITKETSRSEESRDLWSGGNWKIHFASNFRSGVYRHRGGVQRIWTLPGSINPHPGNILDEIEYVKNNPGVCKTLVIDTIDWAEMLCIEHICNKHQKNGIEDFDTETDMSM